MYFPSVDVRDNSDPTFTEGSKWLRPDVMEVDRLFMKKRRSFESGQGSRFAGREESRLRREYEGQDPVALGKTIEEWKEK